MKNACGESWPANALHRTHAIVAASPAVSPKDVGPEAKAVCACIAANSRFSHSELRASSSMISAFNAGVASTKAKNCLE